MPIWKMTTMQPFVDSTEVMGNPDALRKRAARDGYLFIRGLIPPEALSGLREKFLPLLRDAGWIRQDRPLADGVADLAGFCVEPEPSYRKVYHQLYRLREFHALQHHPALMGFFERFFGETVLVHPRAISRYIFPQKEAHTTPPHQDFVPIQGTTETWSVWMPLTDCPPEFGGLQVAEGCHRKGVYPIRPSLGAGGLEIGQSFDGRWRTFPFRLGDALIFHSLTPHRALPNRTERLRISVDFRYQGVSDPVAPDTLLPHDPRHITWEDIYREWPENDDLKYYWKRFELTVEPYDNSYHEQRDRMAFEMAGQGDPTARSALTRIIARDADPTKREKAERLLARLDDAHGFA